MMVMDGDMSCRQTELSSSSLLIYRHAAYAGWFHLLIPISSWSTQMTSIKADYLFLLLTALLITHISFGWGVRSSPDLISTQGSSGCFDRAAFEQKWPRDL